jgi:GNAT superfamily N-acetyltransferase
MIFTKKKSLTSEEKLSVYNLWNNEYPENVSYKSIEGFDEYLNKLIDSEHYLAYNLNQIIVAWGIKFVREQEKWFAIIVDSNFHSKGIGSRIMDQIKSNNEVLNGWVVDHNNSVKLNGETYYSPLEFYIKNEFEVRTEARLELENISAVKITWKQKQTTS